MNDKQRLNALLRLRLFFSTEKEMEAFLNYKLSNNHFNKFKDVKSHAYFSMFAEMCREDTNGDIDLAKLFDEYEAASKFYMRKEEGGCKLLQDERALQLLLRGVYLGKERMTEEASPKLTELVENIVEEGIDMGVFTLLSLRLLPKFGNKQAGDVADLPGDWVRAYEFLKSLCHAFDGTNFTNGLEVGVVREMRMHLDVYWKKEADLSRLLLIAYTRKALERIFMLHTPDKLLHNSRNLKPQDMELATWWQASGKESRDDEAWRLEPTVNLPGTYRLFHYKFDHTSLTARFTHSQVFFEDIGATDVCFSLFLTPDYFWYFFQRRELPPESYALVSTDIITADGKTVDELHFEQTTPISGPNLTLRRVKDKGKQERFSSFLDYETTDDSHFHEVAMAEVDVASTSECLVFHYENVDDEDVTFCIDKYCDGRESIEGISKLTHNDNYVLALLTTEAGEEREYLILDYINAVLPFDELETQPYFHPICSHEDFLAVMRANI